MNWSPDAFHECEDGKWRNARGEEGKVITLEEIMEERNKDPGKRRKK